MVISKILEGTLTAGQTSISFTDSDLPNSLIRVFSSNADIIPVSRTLTGTTLTVVYEAQLNNLGVAVEIVKDGMTINDTLTSDATDEALSAKQGKALKGSVDTLSETVAGLVIPDEITDLDDVNVTSIQDGQVLAWDENTSKFVNVNQSGGGEHIYSTSEQVIGKWLDGSTLYEKTITGTTKPDTGNLIIEAGEGNVIRNFYGIIGGVRLINSYLDNLSYSVTWIAGNQHQLGNVCNGSIYQNKSFYVTIEYTKTS